MGWVAKRSLLFRPPSGIRKRRENTRALHGVRGFDESKETRNRDSTDPISLVIGHVSVVSLSGTYHRLSGNLWEEPSVILLQSSTPWHLPQSENALRAFMLVDSIR